MDGNKASNYSNIGTFLLTAVILIIMVIPLLPKPNHDPSTPQQQVVDSHPKRAVVIAWIMPSILALALLAAGVLNVVASRRRDENGDDTDYKELFVAENEARNRYQDKYTVAANKVLELQAALSQPQSPTKSDLERWCEAQAYSDKENINQRVIAVAWEPRRVNERNSHYIEFKITFVNASIFELKSPRLGGSVHFDRHPLPFPPQFSQSFPLARGQKTWISIRQPLTKEIAEDIQARIANDVLADLHFSDLEITFDVEFPGRPTWQWTWKARDSVSVTAVTIF